ncbi:hypothetical protein ABZZ04_23720 [Streptomyces sp. NPDC006435]|uniref:hypothetical protein n=1 Tax=Streptomyces sp. NPDC006435 TaxID=3154300 RepID=UPI0033AC558E
MPLRPEPVVPCTYKGRPNSIEPADDKAGIALISPARLNPYLTSCTSDSAAALALYQWNSGLVAAFFEPFGHLEIVLRNVLPDLAGAFPHSPNHT